MCIISSLAVDLFALRCLPVKLNRKKVNGCHLNLNCYVVTASGLKSSLGMIEELENVESKAEEFPLTLSFLEYLHKIPRCFIQNNLGYVNYLVVIIRSFRHVNILELWISVKILHRKFFLYFLSNSKHKKVLSLFTLDKIFRLLKILYNFDVLRSPFLYTAFYFCLPKHGNFLKSLI